MGLFGGPLGRTGGLLNDGFDIVHGLSQLLNQTAKYLPYIMLIAGAGIVLQTVRTIKGK